MEPTEIKETALCEHCGKEVSFVLVEEEREVIYKGIKFKYPYVKAVCEACGQQVFPVSTGKVNYLAKIDAYKREVGLLSGEEIKAIRTKLGLSQKQFSKILGCGEKTITRYENGAIQDKVFDNFMRMLDLLSRRNLKKIITESLK